MEVGRCREEFPNSARPWRACRHVSSVCPRARRARTVCGGLELRSQIPADRSVLVPAKDGLYEIASPGSRLRAGRETDLGTVGVRAFATRERHLPRHDADFARATR